MAWLRNKKTGGWFEIPDEQLDTNKYMNDKIRNKVNIITPQKAILEYQNYAYNTLNESLRKGKELSKEDKEIDNGLQEAFKKAEVLTHDEILYRDSGLAVTADAFEKLGIQKELKEKIGNSKNLVEFSANSENIKYLNDKLKDYEFKEKGYMSTSYTYEATRNFSEGQGAKGFLSAYGTKEILHINAPKGTKIIDMSKVGHIEDNYKNENEYLLNKNSTLKVKKIYYDFYFDALVIDCDYIKK